LRTELIPRDVALACGANTPAVDPAVELALEPSLWPGVALDGPVWPQYILAFNWALGVLCGGKTATSAGTETEVLYSTVGSLLGALTFGYLIGEIGALLAMLDKQVAPVPSHPGPPRPIPSRPIPSRITPLLTSQPIFSAPIP
jgi:hypothetical protein